MRKSFIDPEIKKIELNLKENIASSGGSGIAHRAFILRMDSEASCTVQDTGEKWEVIDKNLYAFWGPLFACYAGNARTQESDTRVVMHAVPSDMF